VVVRGLSRTQMTPGRQRRTRGDLHPAILPVSS
jgi:hypothetical protein